MKKFIYIAFALCFTLTANAQVSFQRLYDVVQDSTHILSDGIATSGGGFATLGSNIVIEGQVGVVHRAIFTTYDNKGGIVLAKDIYLADSTRLLSTSELIELDNGSFVMSANLDENDLSACVVALDGATADPLWSRRIADEFQLKVSLSQMPGDELVAGSTNLQEGLSIWLSRINGLDGIDIWAKEYTALDEDSNDVPADLFDLHVSTIDSSIIITGQSVVEGGTVLGFHTTKVDREGNVIWSRHIESVPTGLNFQPLGVTEATDTSVYVTGRIAFNDGVTLINSLFVTKYDQEGEVAWIKTLTGSNSTFTNGNDITAFGDNLAISTLGTETGQATVSGIIEIDTAGVILNSQVYRDSLTLFSITGGLSATIDDGLAMFTTRFEAPLDFVSDIVKTGPDLTTLCSSPGAGILEDVPFSSEALGWITTDFADSDTLETDINNANYYNVPTISPSPDQWCPNEPIIDTLDATPSPLPEGVITYEWMGPGVDGATTPFVVGMEEGEFMVTVTINDMHCYTLCDTVNIMRLQEPMVGITPDFSQFCIDGTINLTGNINGVEPIESTEWSTGETTNIITVLEEGNYSISIVDACMEMATATAPVIFPEQLETLTATAEIVEDCDDFLANLTATTNVDGSTIDVITYVWTNANGDIIGEGRTIPVTEPGTYTVSVGFCLDTLVETVVVVSSPPELNTVMVIVELIEDCENFEAKLTAITEPVDNRITYVWTNILTDDVIGQGMMITVTQPGTYTVTATLCGGDDIVANGIAESLAENNELLWPKVFFPNGEEPENRNFGPVNTCNAAITNYTLKIYNRWGNEVFTSDRLEDEWNGQDGGSDSASAVYVWVAEYDLDGTPIPEPQKGDVTLLR